MDYTAFTVLGGIIAMAGVVWKVARDFRSDMDKTVKLLFKRFDDHKDAVDKKLLYQIEIVDQKYAQKAVCTLSRDNYDKLFDSINRKLDILLEERRNK